MTRELFALKRDFNQLMTEKLIQHKKPASRLYRNVQH